ncbi:hypothetical protein BDV18DRAFT_155935 [Aspergillus unguis]
MTSTSPVTKTLHASAVLTGSFLSGSMMTISLLAIPVFFETTTHSSQLLHQWLRMFHYGHRGHPALAAVTLSLYALSSWRRHIEHKSWKNLLLAGCVTVCMTPFTWLVMMPTNKRIFDLATASRDFNSNGSDNIGMEDAKRLVKKWGILHLLRSFFPLIAAGIGLDQLLRG